MPASHEPPSHAGALSQVPEPHVWTPPSEHRIAPGVHTPAHAPLTHAWLTHGTGVPQRQVEAQVRTLLPEHSVCPGVQVPPQAPKEQHEPVHSTPVPHSPFATHV